MATIWSYYATLEKGVQLKLLFLNVYMVFQTQKQEIVPWDPAILDGKVPNAISEPACTDLKQIADVFVTMDGAGICATFPSAFMEKTGMCSRIRAPATTVSMDILASFVMSLYAKTESPIHIMEADTL